jgi:hypothetical protein
MTKQDLIHFRNIAVNGELKTVLRWAVNRIENLESDLREVKTLAKAIQRIGKDN